MMKRGKPGRGQLALIPRPQPDWKLSEATREIGRHGIQKARRELKAHKPKEGNVNRDRLLAGFVPASREFPIDATIKDSPPRVAVHDFDACLMRDLIIDGKVVGTLFSSDLSGILPAQVASARFPSDHRGYQDVGLAACFME